MKAESKRPDGLSESLTVARFRWIFCGLLFAMLLAALSQNILVTALPTIAGELGATRHMAWIITAYLLAATITMPIYGKIGDLVGRRGLIQLAIVIFFAGSIVCGVSTTMAWLITGRAIQGLGGGGLLLLSQTIVGDLVAPRERGRYMGYLGATFGVSSLIGPVIGGWFTSELGWRWSFWITLPLGLFALGVLAKFLPKRTRRAERARLDIAGMVVLSSAISMLVLTVSWGGSLHEWRSPLIIGLIVGTLISAVLFVFIEARAEDPVMGLHLFADRNFAITVLAAVAAGVAVFGTWSYLPSYLQMATGVSAAESGLLMAPLMGSFMIFAVVTGKWISRTGRYKLPPILGMAGMGTALVLISQLEVSAPWWQVAMMTSLFGIGMGSTLQTLVLIAQNSFSLQEIGTVTASSWFFRQVGSCLGTGVIGGLFAARISKSLTGVAGVSASQSLTPADVAGLPLSVQASIAEAYNDALLPIFLGVAPLLFGGALLLCFVVSRPLAKTQQIEATADPVRNRRGAPIR